MKKLFRVLLLLVTILSLSTCLHAAEKAHMNVSSITLVKGETYNLKVIQDGKTVNASAWKSQNQDVVSVSSKGKITAKLRGSSIIQAQVNGKTVECVVSVIEKTSSKTIRYCVFIMDVSSSMMGSPLTIAKGAVKKFIDKLKAAEGRNYMALVTLNSDPQIICSFTDNYNDLKKKVDGLSAKTSTNIDEALRKADQLLSNVPKDTNIIKNVVLLSDGLPTCGKKKASGKYKKDDYNQYQYANADYSTDKAMKNKNYFIYALGFFNKISGKTLEFGKKHMKDLASVDKYYIVADGKKLEETVIDIADSITNLCIIPDQLKMYVGDSNYTLKLYSSGKKVSKVTWSSDNSEVASVNKSSGSVKPKKAGSAVITATYKGKTASCKVTVENPTVTVLLNGNGGDVEKESIEVVYSKKYGNLPIATRSGYNFIGWYTKKSKGKIISSDTVVTNLKKHTLYAHWEKKKHRYKFYDISMTREEASRYCKAQNGYLACIGSKEEQKYIKSLIPENPGKYSYWIGAKAIPGTKKWIWDDGTPFKYSKWNEHNKEGKCIKNEDCAAMIAVPRIKKKVKGEWLDTFNEGEGDAYDGHYDLSHFGFICEWDE